MMQVRTEESPALITHYMPDNSHATHINCWCNPTLENGISLKGSIMQHNISARKRYVVSQLD